MIVEFDRIDPCFSGTCVGRCDPVRCEARAGGLARAARRVRPGRPAHRGRRARVTVPRKGCDLGLLGARSTGRPPRAMAAKRVRWALATGVRTVTPEPGAGIGLRRSVTRGGDSTLTDGPGASMP